MVSKVREQVKKELKRKWHSAYSLNLAVKSASGDREMRRLRASGIEVSSKTKTEEINGVKKTYKLYKIK